MNTSAVVVPFLGNFQGIPIIIVKVEYAGFLADFVGRP